MRSRLYYEAHITIDPVPESEREEVEAIAAQFDFRLAKLLMDKGQPNSKDAFMTVRSGDLDEIKGLVRRCVSRLSVCGYRVRRWKIEDTLFDSRAGDGLGDLR